MGQSPGTLQQLGVFNIKIRFKYKFWSKIKPGLNITPGLKIKIWARAHMGQDPYGPGPIWARAHMGRGPYGPRAPGPSLLGEHLPKKRTLEKRVQIVFFGCFWDTKKMRGVRTIILAAVSRRDLCYVSESKGFRFAKRKRKEKAI